MNLFQVLFWVVWSVYPVYLLYVLREARRRKKELGGCAYCKHYTGCKELHKIIDDGIPLPHSCEDYEYNGGGKPRGRRGWRRKKAKV